MRLLTLSFRLALFLCVSLAACLGQSLVLPVPQNFQTAYNTGQFFSVSFSGIQGGTLPNDAYFLTISGDIPPGLLNQNPTAQSASLTPTIQGNLTVPGTYTFTVVANDKTLPTPLTSNPVTLTITVTTLPVTLSARSPLPAQAAGTVPTGGILLGQVAGGNTAPLFSFSGYTAAVVSGALPNATSLSVEPSDGKLRLVGAFLTPGTYNFSVVVSDTSTPPVSSNAQSFTVTISENPFQMLPAAGNLPGLSTQTSITASPYATGGVPPYTWTIVQGTPPPGLNFVSQTPFPFVEKAPAFAGTPSAAGTYSYTLQVKDSSSPALSVTQTYTTSVIDPVSYTLPSIPTQQPFGIAATPGPNAALWFTQPSIGSVESITTGGTFQYETLLPGIGGTGTTSVPAAIASGPDGYLWVASAPHNVYRVKADGSSTVSNINLQTSGVPSDLVQPVGITSGNDGAVWFTGFGASQLSYIGRISADGSNALAFYFLPSVMQAVSSIVQDPADSNHLWFLASAGGNVIVGRIKTDGTLDVPSECQTRNASIGQTSFPACIILDSKGALVKPDSPVTASPRPLITLGSDGAIWFATGGTIMGRITSDGANISLFPIDDPSILSLALGSDSSIWYVDGVSAKTVSRITPNGQFTTFPVAQGDGILAGVASGSDGALWVTDQLKGAIYKFFPSLALSCTGPQSFQVGVAITISPICSAFGGKPPYAYTFDTSNLPPGITVSSTGVLSGTPTAPGSFTVKATDSSSTAQQASQVFSIQAAPSIQLTCSFPAIGAAGQSYTASCSTAGGTPPYTYSATPGLPAGLTGVATSTTDPVTGKVNSYLYSVSGTISSAAYGANTFTVTATDSASPTTNSSAPQTITIQISPIPESLSCSSNAQAIVGKPFQQGCLGSGGALPYTFSATGLPAGLTINSSTGLVSGVPTTAGQSAVSVVLTDSAGQKATQQFNLSVINPKLILVCPLPGFSTAGTPFSAICSVSGGKAPLTYSVVSGSLPAGLTFSSTTGIIAGTPTAPGPATFSLQVGDSSGAIAQQIVNLFIQPTSLTILSKTIPVPNSSLPYAVLPSVGGGTPPYSFSISAGALPTGLQLGQVSGAISKVDSATLTPGPYSFTLQVTDAVGATATQPYSGTILPPLVQNFTSFPLSSSSGANGITAGPDGALWFTTLDQTAGNLIGRITTSGTVSTTASANSLTRTNLANGELPTGGDIAAGPDGEIWVAQRDGNTVSEVAIDLSSQLTYVPTTPNSGPAQLIAAPDGTLWFTEAAASKIAHVGPGGTVVEFPTPSPSANPTGIAVGPDNFIIFTEPGANKIGFVSQDGATTADFAIPTANSLPTSIVLGPDNALWFTEYGTSKIGRIDFSGNIQEIQVSAAPQAITLGPDGALYFTETAANKIGRITILGAVTEIPIPDANSGPTGIVAGSDGAIWFTENNLSKIGRLNFIVAPTVTCTLPTAPLAAGAAFVGSCTATQGTPPYQFTLVSSATSTPPPGVTIDPTSGALSGTLTAAGTFTFSVMVTDSSSTPQTAQHSYTFTVTPLALSLSCTTPPARLYTETSPGTIACKAANGTGPFTYSLAAGTLPPGMSFVPATASITGTPTTLGDYPVTIQVTDSSVPSMTASQAITVSVQYGTVTGKGTQLFTLSTSPLSVVPASTTPGLTLSVNELLLQSVTGTAVLTFSNPPQGVPAGYQDPALQFVDANGKPLGATYNFTFPPGTTSLTLPAIYSGTVVGTIVLTVNAAGLPQIQTTFPVAGDLPVIESGSVKFANVTATGFDIEFIAMVPTRDATRVTITFNPASGDAISGQQTFVFDVTQVSAAWFNSAQGLKYGGRYSLTIPFLFNGSISAIGSATVTLTSGGSNTSQPVTGGR